MDGNAAHAGVPVRKLMRNAAAALHDEIVKRFAPKRPLIVAGPGNNGGDGLVLAQLLARDAEPRILLSHRSTEFKTPEARWAYRRLDLGRIQVEVFSPQRFREWAAESDLIVDALLGSGVHGELREPFRSMVREVARSDRPLVSVDVPTGMGTRTALRPDVTVALHAKKPGQSRANSGTLVVRDIGIPPSAVEEVGPGDFAAAYPRNEPTSHKGQNGRVLVVAGGPYTGAPLLCSRSCLRSGVDLVQLYAPMDAAHAAQAAQADLIVRPGLEARRLVPEDVRILKPILRHVDVVLAGPGVGDHPETREAIQGLLHEASRSKVRVVLDADAIAVAGDHPTLARRLRPLVTPHAGEYKEFTGKSLPKTPDAARRQVLAQARRLRSTLLVKGATDYISDGTRLKTNHVHHPGMTTGGTGDVLAGTVAGFVAKGMDPFRAACAAAFVNGAAGVRVARRQGGALLASDLVEEMPRVFRRYLKSDLT